MEFKFKDVVEMVKEGNEKVDELLKAARLERHEKTPMSKETIAMILNYAVGTLAMILGFAAPYMIIYFTGR